MSFYLTEWWLWHSMKSGNLSSYFILVVITKVGFFQPIGFRHQFIQKGISWGMRSFGLLMCQPRKHVTFYRMMVCLIRQHSCWKSYSSVIVPLPYLWGFAANLIRTKIRTLGVMRHRHTLEQHQSLFLKSFVGGNRALFCYWKEKHYCGLLRKTFLVIF